MAAAVEGGLAWRRVPAYVAAQIYIGVMGPRHRTERMLRELDVRDADVARIHAPVGLDIGANGPAEMAVSIIAEMRAVLEGRSGGMLRERPYGIHGTPDEGTRVMTANVVVAA